MTGSLVNAYQLDSSATEDLKSIGDYIEQHDGPTRARQITISIYQAIKSLAQTT